MGDPPIPSSAAQRPRRRRDDMLEDMRRAGQSAGQARGAEDERAARERAQAQMSAMHLASAGSGGPPAQGGGPPHGYGAQVPTPHHGAQVPTPARAAPTGWCVPISGRKAIFRRRWASPSGTASL